MFSFAKSKFYPASWKRVVLCFSSLSTFYESWIRNFQPYGTLRQGDFEATTLRPATMRPDDFEARRRWGQATLRPGDFEARYVWVTFPNLNIGLKVATLRPMFGLEVATTLRPDDVEARYVWVTTPKKEWAAGNISIVQMFKKCNRFQNGKKSHHGNGNYKLFYSDCILRIPFQLLTNLLYKWSKMQ